MKIGATGACIREQAKFEASRDAPNRLPHENTRPRHHASLPPPIVQRPCGRPLPSVPSPPPSADRPPAHPRSLISRAFAPENTKMGAQAVLGRILVSRRLVWFCWALVVFLALVR